MRRGFAASSALVLLALGRLEVAVAAEIATTISYQDSHATSVGVAGEFSNWKVLPLTKNDPGKWSLTLPLKPGTYGYKFVLDDKDWIFDPANLQRKMVNDIENSALIVGDVPAPAADPTNQVSVVFQLTDAKAQSVHLAGEFNQWNTSATPLKKDDAGQWSVSLPLKPGRYAYKFVVDGEWKQDPANSETVPDGLGGANSVKVVGH